jgi:ATP-dependent helicase/nuclease subunit B
LAERFFLGWDRPLLPTAVGHLIDRYSHDGALDLRGVVLVLPGGRAGRRLKELLLEQSERQRLRLAPPDVLTIGGLPELFYRPGLPFASPLVLNQAWARALEHAGSEILEGLFGSTPCAGDLLGWTRLGSRIGALQREVAGAGLRFRDVAAACSTETALLFDDSHRWALLAQVQEAYEERIAAAGYSDPDLARLDALTREATAAEGDVWLIGIAELPRITARIVARASSAVVCLVQAPADESVLFDELGCVRPEVWEARPLPVEPRHVRVADRPADQAAAVVRELEGFGGASLAEIVIGVADEEITPFLHDLLEMAGVSAHSAAGSGVDRALPYRLLEATAAFLETSEWPEFAGLIRHPDLERRLTGRRPSTETSYFYLEGVDRYFHDHLPGKLAPGTVGPSRQPRPLELLRSAELLGRLEGTRPLSEWAAPILVFLTEIYRETRFSGHDPGDHAVLEVLRTIKDAAVELQQLPAALSPGCVAAVGIRILLDRVSGRSIAEGPEATSIEMVGWLELALDDAPFVVITGVNEGRLPRSESADAFLPDSLRARLGLLDNATRYARDAFHLETLIRSRAAVRLITGRVTADGDPLRPSRLLLTQRGMDLAERVLAFVRGTGGGESDPSVHGATASAESGSLAYPAAARPGFALPPERTLAIPPPLVLPVTAFRRILEDPFRFALEEEIGYGPGDDQAREMDPLAFGGLAHDVLRRFGHSPEANSIDARRVRERLERLLEEEVRGRFGVSTYATVHLQVEHLRLRLARFAEWQARRAAEGWRVRHVEGEDPGAEPGRARPGSSAVAFDVDGESVLLTGRIDRIDENPTTGAWAIFDYKTGDGAEAPEERHRRKGTGEWKDLQLPLYRHLAAGLRTASGEPLLPPRAKPYLGYILLPKDLDCVGAAQGPWSDTELEEADEAARAVVRRLRAGFVTFDPGRVRTWPGDPLAPLLGLRQLAPFEADDEVVEGIAG